MVFAVLVAYIFKPAYRNVGHVLEVVLDVGEFSLDTRHQFVRLVLVILEDALHLYLEQAQDVVASDVAMEGVFHHHLLRLAFRIGALRRHLERLVLERFELLSDEADHLVLRFRLLELLLLIYSLLYEDALQ